MCMLYSFQEQVQLTHIIFVQLFIVAAGSRAESCSFSLTVRKSLNSDLREKGAGFLYLVCKISLDFAGDVL